MLPWVQVLGPGCLLRSSCQGYLGLALDLACEGEVGCRAEGELGFLLGVELWTRSLCIGVCDLVLA